VNRLSYKKSRLIIPASLVLTILLGLNCAGSNSTTFVHPEYSFQYLERVAVVPFDNLSNDKGAGERVSRIFVTELLAKQVFDVVEPGEVSRVLMEKSLVRTSELTQEQIISVGTDLGVQGIILGTVNESLSLCEWLRPKRVLRYGLQPKQAAARDFGRHSLEPVASR